MAISRHHKTLVEFIITILVAALAGFGGGFFGFQYAMPRTNESGYSRQEERVVKVSEDSATIDVVKRVSPSVVSIIVSKDLSKVLDRTGDIFGFDDFFEFGLPNDFRFEPKAKDEKRGDKSQEKKEKQKVGGGSGFIVDSNGLILTNKHVVSDADAEYTVVTNDGKEYPAKVLATDQVNDVAILKIDAKNLVSAELGDSDRLQIGQTVIAIGNSLGEYRNTVTRGVISGIDRSVQATDGAGQSEVIQEAIQTDAAINPGNSGGPLLNLAGQVIGINTAVNRAGQSIGFAIPIAVAKRPLESFKKNGRIIRPFLGVRYRLINEDLVKKNNLSVNYGALVGGNIDKGELGVIGGSPAEKAGLREGDIILSVDGMRIDAGNALANTIAKYAPGDEITLRVLSAGKERDVVVKLEEFKDQK